MYCLSQLNTSAFKKIDPSPLKNFCIVINLTAPNASDFITHFLSLLLSSLLSLLPSISKNFFELSSIRQAAQRSAGVTITGVFKRCVDVALRDMVE